MPELAYHLQDFTTLDMKTSAGDATPVAGVRGVTLTANVERDNVFTADDTTRDIGKQREFSVDVNIEYAKFDPEIVKEWLGGDGVSATAWGNNSDPQQFELTFNVDATDQQSGEAIEVTVGEIEFDEMPIFDGSHDDWAMWDLSGTGYALTNFDVTTTA